MIAGIVASGRRANLVGIEVLDALIVSEALPLLSFGTVSFTPLPPTPELVTGTLNRMIFNNLGEGTSYLPASQGVFIYEPFETTVWVEATFPEELQAGQYVVLEKADRATDDDAEFRSVGFNTHQDIGSTNVAMRESEFAAKAPSYELALGYNVYYRMRLFASDDTEVSRTPAISFRIANDFQNWDGREYYFWKDRFTPAPVNGSALTGRLSEDLTWVDAPSQGTDSLYYDNEREGFVANLSGGDVAAANGMVVTGTKNHAVRCVEARLQGEGGLFGGSSLSVFSPIDGLVCRATWKEDGTLRVETASVNPDSGSDEVLLSSLGSDPDTWTVRFKLDDGVGCYADVLNSSREIIWTSEGLFYPMERYNIADDNLTVVLRSPVSGNAVVDTWKGVRVFSCNGADPTSVTLESL